MLSVLGKWVPEVSGHDHLASPKPDISGFWLHHILNWTWDRNFPTPKLHPKIKQDKKIGPVIARDGWRTLLETAWLLYHGNVYGFVHVPSAALLSSAQARLRSAHPINPYLIRNRQLLTSSRKGPPSPSQGSEFCHHYTSPDRHPRLPSLTQDVKNAKNCLYTGIFFVSLWRLLS